MAKGAKVDNRNKDGATPLMLTAGKNPNHEVITVLLKAGANLDDRAKGGITPLMLAAAGFARKGKPSEHAAMQDQVTHG